MEANVLTTGLLAKTKPEVIDSLNNGQGTFLYNHNIKEVKVIADKEGSIEITTDVERATGTMFQYDSFTAGWYGALLSANAIYGANAGFGCLIAYSRSSSATANLGFRLCRF